MPKSQISIKAINPPPKWSETVIHKIYRLQINIERTGNAMLKKNTSLDNGSFSILMTLKEYPDFNQQKIADFLNIPKSRMSLEVEDLIQKKMILRSVNPINRRSHILKITAEGDAEISRAYILFEPSINELLQVLNEDEILIWKNLTDKLIAQTESMYDKSG